MGIFETHAHYTDDAFNDDREKIITDIHNEGVDVIVEIGDCIERSIRAVRLASKFDFMYCAVGIHPECVDEMNEGDFVELKKLLDEKEKNKIVAIGEIGLDYYYTKDNKEKQIDVFEKQLEIALSYNLPVVIHSREACNDTLEIVKKYCQKGLRGIIHCFGESVEIAKEYEKLGMLIGVGGVVTFKNGRKLADVVRELDMKNFVIETDSPYLSPEPYRGKRNDSRNLKYVAQKIAEIKDISYEDVVNITFTNAQKIYGFEN